MTLFLQPSVVEFNPVNDLIRLESQETHSPHGLTHQWLVTAQSEDLEEEDEEL